ncbi:MAG: hypothetical protein H6667_03495 [Ardenticatenaceae bacterium]|nr:hypothetical protein [Ardenticatenaceae bacterium]
MKINLRSIQVCVWGKQVPLVYFVLVGAIAFSLFLIQYQQKRDKWDTSISLDYGYRIEYPANWVGTVIKASRGANYLHGRINDNFLLPRSYMLMYSQPLNAPTFKEGSVWAEKIITEDCGYICWEEMQTQRVGIRDYLALTTTYQGKVSLGQTLYRKVVVVVADDGLYMLQFNTYNPSQEAEKIFSHMLDSFEILEVEK